MDASIETFGSLVRRLRGRMRLGLREFCVAFGTDPSNWSKVERGLLTPPEDDETLDRLAGVLGIEQGGAEWWQLRDLAFANRGKIPSDIMSDENLVRMLPQFFRTLRGKKPEENELRKLAEKVRRS